MSVLLLLATPHQRQRRIDLYLPIPRPVLATNPQNLCTTRTYTTRTCTARLSTTRPSTTSRSSTGLFSRNLGLSPLTTTSLEMGPCIINQPNQLQCTTEPCTMVLFKPKRYTTAQCTTEIVCLSTDFQWNYPRRLRHATKRCPSRNNRHPQSSSTPLCRRWSTKDMIQGKSQSFPTRPRFAEFRCLCSRLLEASKRASPERLASAGAYVQDLM